MGLSVVNVLTLAYNGFQVNGGFKFSEMFLAGISIYIVNPRLNRKQQFLDFTLNSTVCLDCPEKLLEDYEVQEFARILVDEEDGAGIKVNLTSYKTGPKFLL